MKRRFGGSAGDTDVGDFDYQAKLEALRRDPNKTRVLIGDRFVWVAGCEWETAGRRCRMAQTAGGYCPWHGDCVHGGDALRYASDPAEFERWMQKTERWRGEFNFIWGKINGFDDSLPALQ